MTIHRIPALLACALLLPTAATALTPDDILNASHDGGPLADGQTGLAVAVQVLLDRQGVSPGVIDGYKGGMTESALRAFESREGFDVDGILDAEIWSALGGASAAAILREYTVTEEDASGLTDTLPDDVSKLAKMDAMGFLRVSERLAERFHMDEDFLTLLNPDAAFAPGDVIRITATEAAVEGAAARVEIRKGARRAVVLDADGKVLANYPVTIGSEQTPSPSGTHEVTAVAIDPTYTYDPDENFQQGDNDEALILPPGPNGPVGSVWIGLSEPTFGLHGTDTPSQLFETRSHGCVRFTNWDAEELAGLVSVGTVVEFLP